MKDEIKLTISIEKLANVSKINDLIRNFVFNLQKEGVEVTDYNLIETKFQPPKNEKEKI